MTAESNSDMPNEPDIEVNVGETFGFESSLKVPAFSILSSSAIFKSSEGFFFFKSFKCI